LPPREKGKRGVPADDLGGYAGRKSTLKFDFVQKGEDYKAGRGVAGVFTQREIDLLTSLARERGEGSSFVPPRLEHYGEGHVSIVKKKKEQGTTL